MLLPQEFLSALLVLGLTLTAQAQDAKGGPKTVRLRRGQTLDLTLSTPIDSGHAKPGDDITLKLVRPLIADGATVLPADWIVHAKVTKVKHAGKNCRDGQLVWKLDPIKTPGGDRITVQKVYSYPANLGTGYPPRWVPLDRPLKKISVGVVKTTGALAAYIALSPLMVPMAIALSIDGRCKGEAGPEQTLYGDFVAVSTDIRVTPLP
jgi:hypothetical protein